VRLAYDLSVLRRPPGGTAVYARQLLRAMSEAQGDDLIVATDGWPRARRDMRFRRFANLASDIGWLTIGSTAVAARHRVDAWYSPSNFLPTTLRRPMIVTIHDVNFLTLPDHHDRAFSRYAQRAFRGAARRAAAVLTVSEFSRKELIERLDVPADRVTVAYPGVDHVFDIPPGPPDPRLPARYALFVGQSEPHKNVGVLVQAWQTALIPAGLHLVIAGPPGRDDDRLRQAIAASPARPRIHMLGWVDGARLARLYEDATCFVFPSLVEGFGLPPLEAMAHGIPTAVADRASLPEIIGHGALTFDPGDAVEIARAVERLCDDDDLRQRLSEEGRRVAARYRWQATGDIVWRTIRSIAA
jgi:glycosyltransferase involved in cell wall biosynthesis